MNKTSCFFIVLALCYGIYTCYNTSWSPIHRNVIPITCIGRFLWTSQKRTLTKQKPTNFSTNIVRLLLFCYYKIFMLCGRIIKDANFDVPYQNQQFSLCRGKLVYKVQNGWSPMFWRFHCVMQPHIHTHRCLNPIIFIKCVGGLLWTSE